MRLKSRWCASGSRWRPRRERRRRCSTKSSSWPSKRFRCERGIKATGQLSGATRVSLNREVENQKAPDPERDTLRLVLNMERWRWMPENLGKVHVENNIPEFMTRVVQGRTT